jgi:hypothetical protein
VGFRWREELLEAIRKSPHESLLSGWLVLLLGVFILGVAAFTSVPKLRAYRWVDGTALVAATDIYQRTGKSHDWCGRLSYTYIVDGHTYSSRNVSPSFITDVGCDLDKAKVAAWLTTLPAGAVIRIFYDPASPARAALVREGLKWHDFFFLLLAIACLAMSSYCIVQAKRVLRQ